MLIFVPLIPSFFAYEGSTMLELAIWKSKIEEQTDGVINVLDADMKMGCRIDSLLMVDIIIPNVLSFIHGGDDEYNDDNNDDDDDNGNSDDDDDSEEEDDDSDNDDDSDEDDGGD